jgi:GAF domain/PAS fold
LTGQSVLNVFIKEDRGSVEDQLTTCIEEFGRPHSWEIRKIPKDGSILWVRENAKAVRRSGDDDVIILIACKDITETGSPSSVWRRNSPRRASWPRPTASQPALQRYLGRTARSWNGTGARSGVSIGSAITTLLRCGARVCGTPDIDLDGFERVCREWSFEANEGLVGLVWRTGKPIWMPNATEKAEFLRAEAVAQAGLRGAVMFPVLLDTEPLAVVEFFGRAARERDDEQLATLSAIGSQIGPAHQAPARRGGAAHERGALAQAVRGVNRRDGFVSA